MITRYIDRFEYASPQETPALMSDLVDWYNDAEQSGRLTPVELAAIFHYRYIRIHPFEDGNGRIARLMVNYILSRHNYPMIVVRSRKKNDYLEALRKTVVDITVYFNGKFTYQHLYGRSSGTYPNMIYTFSRKEIYDNDNCAFVMTEDGLILNCTFNSSSMFTAVSESDKLPHKLIFNRDDVVLDINGDGEID